MEFKMKSINEALQEELKFSINRGVEFRIRRGLDWFYDKVSIPCTKSNLATPKSCAQQMLFLADITSKNEEEEALFDKMFDEIYREYLESNKLSQGECIN